MLQERQDRQGAMLRSTYRSNSKSGGRLKGGWGGVGLKYHSNGKVRYKICEGYGPLGPPVLLVPSVLKTYYYREFLARTNALEKQPTAEHMLRSTSAKSLQKA